MIDLNQKFGQYGRALACSGPGEPYPCCAGSRTGSGCSSYLYDLFLTITDRNQHGATVWTGDPQDTPESYTYNASVNGWAALAREMAAANVPFAARVDILAWWSPRQGYDDPGTPGEDESATSKSALYRARVVFLDRNGAMPSHLAAATADLHAHGVRYVLHDSAALQYPTE